MAKYTVDHTCGHTVTHQLYGPGKDRDRKLAWLETVSCPDCRRTIVEAEREALNGAAAQSNQEAGLPELTGTPKQVAWAESIRAELLKTAEAYAATCQAAPGNGDEALRVRLLGYVRDGLAELRSHAEAAWWIDQRFSSGQTHVSTYARARFAAEGGVS